MWGTIRVTDHHPSENRQWSRRRATQSNIGGAERSRRWRCGILQRVLYLAFRSTIAASHDGVPVHDSVRGELRTFLRLIPYKCDQPEERAVF